MPSMWDTILHVLNRLHITACPGNHSVIKCHVFKVNTCFSLFRFFHVLSRHFENVLTCEFCMSHHAKHVGYHFACAESTGHQFIHAGTLLHRHPCVQSEHASAIFSLNVFPCFLEFLLRFFSSHVTLKMC